MVGSRRGKAVVPPRLGVMLKTMALLPDGIRHRIGRAAHFHAAFTDLDPQARAAYHRRIATAPPSNPFRKPPDR